MHNYSFHPLADLFPRIFGSGILVTDITAPRYPIGHDAWTFVLGLQSTADLCKRLRRRRLYNGANDDGAGWIEGARGAVLRPAIGFYFVVIETGRLLLIEQERAGSMRFYWPVVRRKAGRMS
jgi:hypothetical protein